MIVFHIMKETREGRRAMSIRKHKNAVIVMLCTVAYFASYFSRKTFAAVMVEMIGKSVIDNTVAGLVGSALFVFYGVGQLVSGYLGDRLQPKYLMFAGLITSALCNIVFPLIQNQYWLIPVWAINGFAQALLWPPIVRILAESLSHERYVTANLIITFGAHISTILLYIYAPFCISFMSYREVFFTSGIFCIAVGIIFIIAMTLVLRGDSGEKAQANSKNELSHDKSTSAWKTLFDSGVLPLLFAIIAMGFMRDGIESWLPTLYSQAFNRDSEESILVSVVLPIFAIVSVFIVRVIHKTKLFNNESTGALTLFGISAVLCVPFSILISIDDATCRIICLLLGAITCACMHSCNFLLISCVPGRFAKTGKSSTIGGICNACTYIGSAISMYGIAYMSEALGWSLTVVSWIGVLLLGGVASILAIKKYTKFIK